MVRGTVVDFESGQLIVGAASVITSGLTPAPTITSTGAAFTIQDVPENSAFQLLASAPSHRPTFSEAVLVGTEDLVDITAAVVSETFVASLATGFQITPSAARGILLARVVDDRGEPKAGVAKAAFVLDASVSGPFFLGDNRQPLPSATATSASGWVVWFEVAPGVAKLSVPAAAAVTLDMAVSPVSAGTITLAQIRATDGAPVLPSNISFASQIIPIFARLAEGGRGCTACHSGNGIGKDLGGLALDGSTAYVFKELIEEDPLRVQRSLPEKSQLLTYPSREDPPDRHPNVTFTSPLDPDYLKILVWIREGAKDN
ncbi:MAG TPA: hypothetical protein VNO30_07340 [Kofleriaceae bacterium]|nr:hypothetical protein [Kofleriaceae bacterium]